MGSMKPLDQVKFNFVKISSVLARKVPGQGKLQLFRGSAQEQLLAARPGPCKTKKPTTPKKSAKFTEKNEQLDQKLDQIWAPKTGPRNWFPGALAINFPKEGRILDQLLGPISGPKNWSQKSKKNRQKMQKLNPSFGPQRKALQSIFAIQKSACVGDRPP